MGQQSQAATQKRQKFGDRWVRGDSGLIERLALFARLPRHLALARIGYLAKRPFFLSPLHAMALRGRAPTTMLLAPSDPWPGNAARGAMILTGEIELGGQKIADPAPLWQPIGAEKSWLNELHGFGWLRDLRAAAGDRARRTAREMVDQWIDEHSRWSALAWDPAVTGTRLANWFGQYEFFGSSASLELRLKLLDSMARQARYLARSLPAGLSGLQLIRALKGLIYAGIFLPEGQAWLERGMKLLLRELPKQILPDGGHVERSPQRHLEVLRHLIDIRASLHGSGREVPGDLISAIESMSPVLRMFLHGDGGLTLFNDSNEEQSWQIDMVLQRAEGRKQPRLSAPQSGFQRLQAGRIIVIADCGAPPPPSLDLSAHAGTLSFEMSVGRERLIVNCGVQQHHPQWRGATRATAAHSTAVLGETNAAHLIPGGGLARRPQDVSCRRDEAEGSTYIDASHDGYLEKFGLLHRRKLTLRAKGEALFGEDLFTHGDHQTAKGKPEYALRFHLHPDVQATLASDGQSVLLRLQKGGGWQFSCEGPHLALEPSVYMGKSGEIRRCQQIVLSGITGAEDTVAQWSLTRLTQKKTKSPPDQANLWDL